jgi:hypothetical protein
MLIGACTVALRARKFLAATHAEIPTAMAIDLARIVTAVAIKTGLPFLPSIGHGGSLRG